MTGVYQSSAKTETPPMYGDSTARQAALSTTNEGAKINMER